MNLSKTKRWCGGMGFAACKDWLIEQLYLLRAIFHGMAF
ncbi:Hypothetical protein Eab7_0904 [Exiguobacterium antarcticum B7]|nr:Hypothetical protein Eab7_0904 [Exiguobacterium antarcticum B7]